MPDCLKKIAACCAMFFKISAAMTLLLFAAAPTRADMVTNLGYPQPQSGTYGQYGTAALSLATDTLPSGAPGIVAALTSKSNNGGLGPPKRVVPVIAGQTYTVSYYVKYISGPADASILVTPEIFGGSGAWVGINFNAQYGFFQSLAGNYPGTYMVGKVTGNPSWIRVALTFTATADFLASGVLVGEWHNTTLNVWGYDFINASFTAQHIDTTNGPATGANQLNPYIDNLASPFALTDTPAPVPYTGMIRSPEFTALANSWPNPNPPPWPYWPAIFYFGTNSLTTFSTVPGGMYYAYCYVKKTSVSILDFIQIVDGTEQEITIEMDTSTGNIILQGIAPHKPVIYASGVIDAGESYLIWAAMEVAGVAKFQDGYVGALVETGISNKTLMFPTVLGHLGLQEAGIFP